MKKFISILSVFILLLASTSFGQVRIHGNLDLNEESNIFASIERDVWTNWSVFEIGPIINGSKNGFNFELLKFNRSNAKGKLGFGTTLMEGNSYKISDSEILARYYLFPIELTVPFYLHWKSSNDLTEHSNYGVQLKIWQSSFSQLTHKYRNEYSGVINSNPPLIQNYWFGETRVSFVGYYNILTVDIGCSFDLNQIDQFNFSKQAFIRLMVGVPGSMKFKRNSKKNKQNKNVDAYKNNLYDGYNAEDESKNNSIAILHKQEDIPFTSDNSASKANPVNERPSIPENNVMDYRSNTSFISPIDKNVFEVSSAYGYREHPYWGKVIFHNGVDLSCSLGTPVNASKNGFVIETGFSNSYGNYVILKHDSGYKTLYAHLHRILIKNGEHVSQGQNIGTVGNTGISTGPHLHFEILHNDENLDPVKYLN